MVRTFLRVLIGLAGSLLLSATALAGGHNLAEYPLRVHIFQFSGYSHYSGQVRSLEAVDGEGRANLYENGQPRGFEFKYRCGERLRVSEGFETYLARWKKPGKEIEILLQQYGKPDSYDTCDLTVLMKENVVYSRHNGVFGEMPAAKFKAWMEKVQYDPEHGKNEPIQPPAAPAAPQAPQGTGTSAARPTGSQ